MVNVLIDDRWFGPHGIGRFAREVTARLPAARGLGIDGSPVHPFDPFRVHRVLRRKRPDVYFSPGFNPPWRSPVPFVFCIHDLIHLDDPAQSSLAKRAYYRWFVLPAVHRAHRIITVSELTRNRILEWSGAIEQSVIVAPNGVDERFTPDHPAHKPGYDYLLYVGAHRPHKNIPRLLEAFARIECSNDVKLVLTGSSSHDEQQVIDQHRLHESVMYCGVLENEALVRYYRGATALVLPSLCEGFGLPALEAMACGTAVIGSNAGAIPEVVGEAGICVDPYDIDAMAHAIQRVVDDPVFREERAAAGRRRAAAFSWDRTASIVSQTLADAAGVSSLTPNVELSVVSSE